MNITVLNHVYRHFKGDYYILVGIATDSETGEKRAIYRALYGDGELYDRSLPMFLSEVDHDKYPDCKQKYRFELQDFKSTKN